MSALVVVMYLTGFEYLISQSYGFEGGILFSQPSILASYDSAATVASMFYYLVYYTGTGEILYL